MSDATTLLQDYARMQALATSGRKWRARAIVHAARWFYMPKPSDAAQCRLARQSAMALIHAVAQSGDAPDWFTKAHRCATRNH